MSEVDFAEFYRDMYAYIDRPLDASHAMTRDEIREGEGRLKLEAPAALVAYYEVAGNEKTFNLCHDELLRPDEWYVDGDRLVFYEAHQAVVMYGIGCDRLHEANPPVEIGCTPRPYSWSDLSPSISSFLQIMTYWQGAWAGAMEHVERTKIDPGMRETLQRDWEFLGELNKMWCYRRPGQIACVVNWDDGWYLHAGGATPAECEKIGVDLGVTWIPWE